MNGYALLMFARDVLERVCRSSKSKQRDKIAAATALMRSAEIEMENRGYEEATGAVASVSSREYLEAVKAEVTEKIAAIDREEAH